MKIGLCGTMSVGKTTLVNELKKLPEFKDYKFATERSKYLNSLGIPLNTDSTLKGQLVFAAERAAELMQEKMITDRTIIDVMAFCEYYRLSIHQKISSILGMHRWMPGKVVEIKGTTEERINKIKETVFS
jgi:GTPase SAR1 family protein